MKKYDILAHFYFLILALVALYFSQTTACTMQNAWWLSIIQHSSWVKSSEISLQNLTYLWTLLPILLFYLLYLFLAKILKRPLWGFAWVLCGIGMGELFVQRPAFLLGYFYNPVLIESGLWPLLASGFYFFFGLLLAYTALVLFMKKDFQRVGILAFILLLYTFLLPKHKDILFYETALIPLVALISFWFCQYILSQKLHSRIWFFIMILFCGFAISNSLRAQEKYVEKCEYYNLVSEITKNLNAEKIDATKSEINLDRLEESAIPHIEFLLWENLQKRKASSVVFPKTPDVFLPADFGDSTWYKASANMIPYREIYYAVCDAENIFVKPGIVSYFTCKNTPIAKFSQAYTQSKDTAYEGECSAKVNTLQKFSMEISIPVESFDKIQVDVKRLGSRNGFLVAMDLLQSKKTEGFYHATNFDLENSIHTGGWETLRIDTILPKNIKFLSVYLMNMAEEPIYFDNLEVRILRQCTAKEAAKAQNYYKKYFGNLIYD